MVGEVVPPLSVLGIVLFFKLLNIVIQLLEERIGWVSVALLHDIVKVRKEVDVVDSLFPADGHEALLPDIFIPVVKVLHFLHELEHPSLVVLHLRWPDFEQWAFQVVGQDVSHMVSVVRSVFSECLAELYNFHGSQIACQVEQPLFIELQSPGCSKISSPVSDYGCECHSEIHVIQAFDVIIDLLLACSLVLDVHFESCFEKGKDRWVIDPLLSYVVQQVGSLVDRHISLVA